MRHLLIGNSHIAAMKLGWDQIADAHPDTELVFTGARGEQVKKLYLDGSILTSRSERGREMIAKVAGTKDPIDVGTFDKVWVVASQVGVSNLLKLYRSYRSESDPNLGRGCQILSVDAFDLAVSFALDTAAGVDLAHQLVGRSLDVGFIPQPMPSYAAFELRSLWGDFRDPADQDEIASLFATSLEAVATRVGAAVATQPVITLQTPITTKVEFARGSSGLTDNEHAEDDIVHMNGDYGRVVIEEHILCLNARDTTPDHWKASELQR